MDGERLEQELRNYFKGEVKKVAPSPERRKQIISRLGEQKRDPRPEKTTFWKFRPSLIAIPLSIFLLVVLVGSFIPMLGGMAPSPPAAPFTISDQAGGAFLVWLDNPYRQYENVIRAQHVDAQGNRLWGEKGKQIASEEASLNGVVSDGTGGMIVAWKNGDSISLEKLDQDGNTIWVLENLTSWSVTEITEDGSGGAILLLYDRSDRIFAQRVNRDGTPLWGNTGVLVSTIGYDWPDVSVTNDGHGGVVVVWHATNDTGLTIQTQRLSAEGKALWGDNGVTIAANTGGQGNHEQVISDGLGNFIIAWDTESGMSGSPDSNVYAQKLDEKGNPLWEDSGILVCKDPPGESYSFASMQSHPQIAADGTGGVIVTWHDRRRIMNREIFAQRISADGDLLWAENGVWVWDIPADYFMTTSGILDAAIIPDGAGGAAVVWTGYEVSYSKDSVLYAQRLSPDGQRLWSSEEVYDEPVFQSQGNSSLVSDGQGGIIIGSRVGESSGVSNTDSVYAQRMSSDGDRLWGGSGLEIQKVPSALTVQFIAAGAILAAILVLIGVFRQNRIAGIFTAVTPVLLGIAGLASILLVIGPFGYTYGWAYIPDTAMNKIAAFMVPFIALAIGAVGISKKTVTLWVMVPVMVFCALVAVIAGLIVMF